MVDLMITHMLEREPQPKNIFLSVEEPVRLLFERYGSLAQQLSNLRLRPDQTTVIHAQMDGIYRAIEETWREKVDPNLSNWDTVQLARHPQRPHTLDYINGIFSEFIELHGDRLSGDDKAIVGGLASLDVLGNKTTVMVIGVQKGRDTQSNIERNFGMARPEGYRKALRLMKHAEKFNFPVIIFVDTPGAAPSAESEERGIAWAISRNLLEMSRLKTPIVSVIIGEGGSGGALALAVADCLLILQHGYFSVVSPEGAAAILWQDTKFAPEAAEQLQLTAKNLPQFIPWAKVIPEPPGGAHRFPHEMAAILKKVLVKQINELLRIPTAELLENRYQQLRHIGQWIEPASGT